MDVDSRQKNATDCEAGEVLKAREQAGFLIYTPWATCLRMPKASRLVIRRLCSRNAVVFRFLGNGRIVGNPYLTRIMEACTNALQRMVSGTSPSY